MYQKDLSHKVHVVILHLFEKINLLLSYRFLIFIMRYKRSCEINSELVKKKTDDRHLEKDT